MKNLPSVSGAATTSPVNVAIYARVSTIKQVGGRFDSVEAQLAACKKYIEDRRGEGWALLATFADPACSGKDMNRPEMKRLMSAIESGVIRVVVVYRLERVMRSTDDWAPFRKLLRKHGCRLESVTQDIEDVTPEGRFRNNMLVNISEYDRENTGVKTSNKMRMQAERGFWNGGFEPYGYTNDPKAKKLNVHPDEAQVVRDVFAMASELVFLSMISRVLTERGVLTRRRTIKRRKGRTEAETVEVGGNRFREDTLRRMISHPIYRGVLRFGGREYKGQHEPLVAEEMWEAANAAISQKGASRPVSAQNQARDKHFNLLKGLLYCGCCKGAFVPHACGKLDPQGRPYRYYTCSRVTHNHAVAKCIVRQIPATAVEETVVGLLGQLARHPTLVGAVLDLKRETSESAPKVIETRIRQLDREIEKVTASLNNLVDAIAESGVSALRDEIAAKFEQLKGRKERALVERIQARQELAALSRDALAPAQVCATLEKFETLWPDFTQEEKREFVRLLIASIEVRSAEGKSDGRRNARVVELKVKLHLPQLLGGGQESESAAGRLGRGRRSFTLDARVQLAAGTGDTVILAPFHHRVRPLSRKGRASKKPRRREHPFERAIRWSDFLDRNADCTARELARREKISEPTMSMTLGLTRLIPAIRQTMHLLVATDTAYHLGLRALTKIAGLPVQKQSSAFAALLRRWGIPPDDSGAKEL